MKLLITSIGSLVGQNILDMIENRHEYFHVIGVNSVAANPRNFRCDIVYLTDQMSNEKIFEKQFIHILEKENPDLILPGRDEDVVFLTRFKEKHPAFSEMIPLGNSHVPEVIFDKYASYIFSKTHDLPFAKSLFYKGLEDKKQLDEFVYETGFPIVRKPIVGFGSRGVYFIVNIDQLDKISSEQDVLFQEYLGPEKDFNNYLKQLSKGIPLYFDIPGEWQCAGQTIIGPDGHTGEVYCSIVEMVRGYPVSSVTFDNADTKNIVKKCADAMYQAGWFGLLNVQMKQDKNGQWKIFEFNPRMTGSTSARSILGYDELGIIIELFKPGYVVPNYSKQEKLPAKIFREMTDYVVEDKQVDELVKHKVYHNEKSFHPV